MLGQQPDAASATIPSCCCWAVPKDAAIRFKPQLNCRLASACAAAVA